MHLARVEYTKLTLEDILNRHRYWISSLYLEDKKSTAEIVEILHENRLQATLLQVQTVIRDWKLDLPKTSPEHQSPHASPHSTMSTPTSRSASTLSAMSCSSNTSYPPSDPDIAILYTFKPLPPLPNMPSQSSRVRAQHPTASDSLHDPLALKVYELKPRLDSIPRAETETGLSILEMYIDVQQSHEMIAVGLSSSLKRGGDLRKERMRLKSRVGKSVHVKKRRAVVARDEDPQDGHSDEGLGPL